MHFETVYQKILGDTYTPVELYLRLRDRFSNSFLLESSDYNSKENSLSYLCLEPLASFEVDHSQVQIQMFGEAKQVHSTASASVTDLLDQFLKSFSYESCALPFTTQGIYGYISYDAIPFFEDLTFRDTASDIPLIKYQFFRFQLVFDHFKNELYLIEHLPEGEKSKLSSITQMLNNRSLSSYEFEVFGEEQTMLNEEEFLKSLEKAKAHCYRGDVFQMVLSRKFRQRFKGDEFNVYRALRSINPSPYLFYFDYGDFKIFGSSPEAQLIVKNNTAYVHPIAGTFKRSGNPQEDALIAERLAADSKENAEHVMLVDLARNDLSKYSGRVKVEQFKQTEYYSHVIHLVSRVRAELSPEIRTIQVFGATFPAGTLSGAPKRKALELIDLYEPEPRGIYGGAVGMLGLNGDINMAIIIRSVLSVHNTLVYQAGCGVVIQSDIQSELQEINNKLHAVRTAIDEAQKIEL